MSTTAEISTTALRELLDGEHADIRRHAFEILSGPDFTPVRGLGIDAQRELTNDRLKTLTDAGVTTLALPTRYGGRDDLAGAIAAFDTVACGDLAVYAKCGVHFMLVRGSIQYLGTQTHHDRYLPGVGNLELSGCAAMTEIGHGSNLQAIRTTATYDVATQEFVIHTPNPDARKEFIGNAYRYARIAVVFARLIVGGTDHGVHALVVPVRDGAGRLADGVSIEDCGEKLGLNGVDNGRITFDHLRVPRDALLDRYAQVSPEGEYTSSIDNAGQRFFTTIGILIAGRVSVAGASISAAKKALTIAIRYALQRRQFGPPRGDEELLLDYRTHQRRLLPALATTYALHFAQEELVAELRRAFSDDEYPDAKRRRFEAKAAALKAAASWHAIATVQECREGCGGAGYMSVNGLAALKADIDPFATFEGDNNVLMQLVAKSLLTGSRDQFEELDPLGMVTYVAGQLYSALVERAAGRAVGIVTDQLAAVRDDGGELQDREWQLSLMRRREEHIREAVARRMKRGVDAGIDPYTVFKDCQDHAATLARAHVDRLVLEAFDAGIRRCEDADLTALLNHVCDLHALSTIERSRGWFLEHGMITSGRSRAIVRAVSRLCGEVRENAELLVEAFGIPDPVLASPLASR
jgi:acyl-CoA oxidase